MKFEKWLKEFRDSRFNLYKEGCSLFDEGKYGEACVRFYQLAEFCRIAERNCKLGDDSH